jgi:choline-sulfatase
VSARRSGRRRSRFPLVALFLAAAACARHPAVFPRAPVVLVSIDTLRADHLPAYGYRGVDTPNLDALARESWVFDNAIAQVPLTLPSHVSLFTGLLPFQHGVRDNLGYRLSSSQTTLASFLRSRGYATGGAVSAIVLEHGSGVAEGFDFYQDGIESRDVAETLGRVQRSGDETEKLLEEWIEKQRPGVPFLAFLHLYEPHTPYEPPEPFKSTYASRPYDGEIAAADAITGRFIAFLKRRGIYDRAVIVFLSDHGEGLGEHGEDEHGILLYREALRVPLFVKLPGPGRRGRRVSQPAALADVFPTVASALGEKPPESLPGVSLLELPDLKDAGRRIYSETLYPRYHFGWSDLAALTDDRYEYIEAPRPELYDWRADPAEKNDLSGGLPPAFRSMRVALEKMERPLQPPGAADPETVRKLASLGYIGGASPNANAKDLPDPKDRLGAIDRLKDATRLVSKHRDEEAVELLARLARENPLMLDVWETLARTLRRSGRPKEALEALEQADRLSPRTPQIMLGLADLRREMGDFDRARSLAEAALAAGASGAAEELATIAFARGDHETARRGAQAALAKSPTARVPLLLLARIEETLGNPAAALTHLDRALEVGRRWGQAPIVDLESLRGDALARLGREAEAEQAFRKEISDFPENLDAWSRLALVYRGAGRPAEFKDLLSEMTRRVPSRRSFETAARICEIVGDRREARRWRGRAAQQKAPGA